jgi:hypothetical protein
VVAYVWQSKGSGFESLQLHHILKLNPKEKTPEKRGLFIIPYFIWVKKMIPAGFHLVFLVYSL